MPEISHSIGSYIIPIGAVAQGKSPKDEEAGFEMLKKMADLRPIWAKDTDGVPAGTSSQASFGRRRR